MNYHIKEWPNETASLIAEDGYKLDMYDNVIDAIEACMIDCLVEPDYIEHHSTYLGASPLDYEASYLR